MPGGNVPIVRFKRMIVQATIAVFLTLFGFGCGEDKPTDPPPIQPSWKILDASVNLNDLWGSTFDTVFGVGQDGSVFRFDGTAWFALTSPTTRDLHGIWGSSVSDIYAVGD